MCAGRNCVYAIFIVLFICAQSNAAIGKGKEKPLKTSNTAPVSVSPATFQWVEHRTLSWDDFRGDINTANEDVAAATHCGIGFKTNVPPSGGKPEITVYNLFYTTGSWVKPDAKIPQILEHEQGHFDLCEIYTRKLRERMKNLDLSASKKVLNADDIKLVLMTMYNEISNEYEDRQQAYEQQTTHGTIITEQKRWQEMIARELHNSSQAILMASSQKSDRKNQH